MPSSEDNFDLHIPGIIRFIKGTQGTHSLTLKGSLKKNRYKHNFGEGLKYNILLQKHLDSIYGYFASVLLEFHSHGYGLLLKKLRFGSDHQVTKYKSIKEKYNQEFQCRPYINI